MKDKNMNCILNHHFPLQHDDKTISPANIKCKITCYSCLRCSRRRRQGRGGGERERASTPVNLPTVLMPASCKDRTEAKSQDSIKLPSERREPNYLSYLPPQAHVSKDLESGAGARIMAQIQTLSCGVECYFNLHLKHEAHCRPINICSHSFVFPLVIITTFTHLRQ